MSFTFVDVESARGRRVAALFLTLVVFYFLGALLLYSATQWEDFAYFWSHRLQHPASRGFFPPLRTLPWIFGCSLLAAVTHWTLSVRRMIPRILDVVGAQPLDPDDRYHRRLANVVAEVSAATGGRAIEAVTVSSRNMNAFALSDLRGRSVIGVSEALLVRLDRRQLEAVVAHEASHLLWGDCLATTVCCSMAAVWAGLLRLSLPDGSREGSYGFSSVPARAFPVLLVIVVMRGLTFLLNVWISRQREHRADATAVRLTRDPLGLAEALHLIASDWRAGFHREADLAPIFIVDPRRSGETVADIAPDLFSTHPPPRERIATLLRLGHADERALTAGIAAKPVPEADTPIARPAAGQRWHALDGSDWRGPFAAVELAALPWVTLFTPVAAGAGGAALAAWEYPELNLLLKRRPEPEPGSGGGGCPKCSQPLRPVLYEGAPLRRCDGCGGRLVGREAFVRILSREEQPASPAVREIARQLTAAAIRRKKGYVALEPGRLNCPDCRGEMARTLYHAVWPSRIEIDRCEACGLLWFDARELEVIEYLSASGPT